MITTEVLNQELIRLQADIKKERGMFTLNPVVLTQINNRIDLLEKRRQEIVEYLMGKQDK